MVARKRKRSSIRLSILERHTQRRIQSIGATTGCQIYAVEKETALHKITEDNNPSITIINSERTLSADEIAALPQKSQLVYLAEANLKANPLPYLTHYQQFDSTILMRDSEIDASTFVQSLLYGMSQNYTSLMRVRFSRWGSARKKWKNLPFSGWNHAISQFAQEIDLPKDVNKRHVRLLHQLEQQIIDPDIPGEVIAASDGVNIILKLKGKFKDADSLIPKLLNLPALAAAISFQEDGVEIMLIQRHRLQQTQQKGPRIFLIYSPRRDSDAASLEEAG